MSDQPAAGGDGKPAGAHAAPKPPVEMAAEPWESDIVRTLAGSIPDAVLESKIYLGQPFLVVRADSIARVLDTLKQGCQFDYLVDLTAIDYPKRNERFELLYIVYSYARRERLRIKTRTALSIDTVTPVHLGANWLEREVYDMFGIEFTGHPDLRRILLPEEWEGFPLRKEHGITQMDQRWVRENLGIESGQ